MKCNYENVVTQGALKVSCSITKRRYSTGPVQTSSRGVEPRASRRSRPEIQRAIQFLFETELTQP